MKRRTGRLVRHSLTRVRLPCTQSLQQPQLPHSTSLVTRKQTVVSIPDTHIIAHRSIHNIQPRPLDQLRRLATNPKTALQVCRQWIQLFRALTHAAATAAAPGASTAAGAPTIAVPPPSMLRGKTIEEIVNRWSSELETHVREFNKFASEVAVWDRALIENGNNVSILSLCHDSGLTHRP